MSAPRRRLALATLIVRDYDEAIAWFRDVLGFTLFSDDPLGGGKRWVTIGPQEGAALLLAKAADASEQARIGDQVAGRVAFFLHTDDFARDHATMRGRGVRFIETPRHEPYGTVAVFADLYGNLWDLIEPAR
ncbi:VOC family protein [Mangrovibrevibacter kandeliae]|uniref:VOC family protein n=1 Tax=Mangrovibrevibacter kandeliae TaxID=2968473 RepID=UPI002118D168|nr:VOC family protein [Aurantimonas sp. CSK15Z-1]MCQ8782183.1 VOC family protein [Aurantimonas sp. CSK15Z-1]